MLSQITPSLSPPFQDFAIEVLLLSSYTTLVPRKEPNNIPLLRNPHTLPPHIIDNILQTFQLTHSYFSSPFKFPTHLTQYHSPHGRDKTFGSSNHTTSTEWACHGYAHITNIDLLPKTINWAKLATQSTYNYTTMITIMVEEWSNHHSNPLQQPNVIPIITIPPLTMQYPASPTLPRCYSNKEPNLTSILIISHSSNT